MNKIFHTILTLIMSLTLALPYPQLASASSMSPTEEKELGQRFHLKIAATGALMDDPIINKYYMNICDKIMRGAGLEPDNYNFHIVRSDGINAFAVPGGFIYMHTETIISLENEDQLASIVGHEVAHITSRHFARRMEAAASISIAYMAAMLAGMFVASQSGGSGAGAAIGQALVIGGTGISVSAMMSNSRSDESEADSKGRKYLIKAGYQARDMYGAFRIMADKTFQVAPNSYMPTYLTTHPALTSRLATSFKDLQDSPPSPPDISYRSFRDRVLAHAGDPRRVQIIMNKRLKANKNDHSALHAMGLLAARQQNLSQANKLMTQALSLAPGNREYLADLGDLALRRRKPDEAKKYFQRAGQNNRQAVLGLARSSDLLGDKTEATKLYTRAITMAKSEYPEALELGGRFFGKIGRRGTGHYYLGKYFASVGNLDQAIFHFKEVGKYSDAGVLKAHAKRDLKLMTKLKKEDK